MRRRSTSALVIASMVGLGGILPLAPATADEPETDRPSYLGRELYTGELHSHTSVSDGVELPGDAFEHVAEETDADFFTVSEHDVMWDLRNGDDFVEDWRDAESEEWRWVHEQTEEDNAEHDDLTVVPAIENTWYDGTGHINVFNTDWHAAARATEQGGTEGVNEFGTGDLKYDMYTFFARLKQDPDAIAQFNHPRPEGLGNFFDFNGLDPVVDERIQLIEVKDDGQFEQFQLALEAGWHLGPVWNGDEHSDNWVTSDESITGIWTDEHSTDGLYTAMRDRSVYSTQDVNTTLAFGADEAIMGSILPAETTRTTFEVQLSDPDDEDSFTSVQLLTNEGEVAHTFGGVEGDDLDLTLDAEVADGDFYYVRADQADGDFVVSAPIWIGETTRGANYAPEISVTGEVPETASYGDQIDLPEVSATDDSGQSPTVSYEVYDAAGEVPVSDESFQVRSYDDHFVVVKAEDDTGNINAELLRLSIDTDELDPDGVFQYFGSTATVADQEDGSGLAVSTDRSIEQVYAQVRLADQDDWTSTDVLTSTNDRPYEVNTIGNDEPEYQHSITGQTLRSHEFDVTGLAAGERYTFRFGVAVDGEAPAPSDTSAWTEVQGEFVASGQEQNEPVYVLGDLQATTHEADDLGLLRDVLDQLQDDQPGGRTVLQTGDLVDNGGRGQYWDEAFEHVYAGLDLQVAPVAGNHETYGDLDYNSQSEERTAIFSNMYDLPEGGAIGESNYSFDRGDIHFAVLNSTAGIDAQLDWLRQDIRSSTSEWNVVVGHYSYYGGRHGSDPDLAADRPTVTAAFDQLGVDLYIGAHDHVYKRSTIYDGRLAETPEEERLGTTFVTMGSAGPKFYDNDEHWWDDVVFDEDTQMGGVLQVTEDGLEMTTRTIDGRTVDRVTVTRPEEHWEVSSAEVVEDQLAGVGLLSYPGSREEVTVVAASYDRGQEQMNELRTLDVSLDHRGREQYVTFEDPLPVDTSETVRVFVWDGLDPGVPLAPAITVREGMDGGGTPEDPYLIQSATDLPSLANEPDGVYRLTSDLDLTDVTMSQLGGEVPFTGVLDGAGYTISNYTAPPNEGVGLFADNAGTIRNLTVHGDVTTAARNAGLLADVNHGTIDEVRTSGAITAETRVAGIVGEHHGTIRNGYSTADVHASTLYSGGVVGIAMGGSVTENVFATGAITAEDRNAGGVVSYGYEDTAIQHVVSLNEEITAGSYAHGILGRVMGGQSADLADNHTSAAVPVTGETLTDPPAADNWKGAEVADEELRTQEFFTGLGWDFEEVWAWDGQEQRPVLRGHAETDGAEPAQEGTAAAGDAAEISHEAVLGSDGTTTVTVHGGEPAAGEEISTVILERRADARRTSPDEVVYLNQATADDAGDVTRRMALPEPGRGGFWIAVGTSAELSRYVARLDATG